MKNFFITLFAISLLAFSKTHSQALIGYSLAFDGVNDYVEVPSNLKGFGISNSFTIAVWINADNDPSWHMLLEDGTQFNSSTFYLGVRPQENELLVRLNTTNSSYFNDDIPVPEFKEKWTFVTYTYDGSTMRLYFNGILLFNRSITGNIINGNRNLRIGFPSGEKYYKGLVDELSIWSIALTQQEIQGIMLRQLRGDEAGLVGNWAFDEGSGDVSIDRTGNNHDGLLGGGNLENKPTWVAFNAPVQPSNTNLIIVPNKGGDIGSTTVNIHGYGFKSNAMAKLVKNGIEIIGSPIAVNISGRIITTTFDLTGKQRGLWDVVVTNPNGTMETLVDGFIIEEGRKAQVWIDILGQKAIRVDRQQTYTIICGNRGNVDAVGVPLWVGGIPPNAAYDLEFEISPPSIPGLEDIDWTTIPIEINRPNEILIPLIIGRIPPGVTKVLPVSITIKSVQELRLRAFINPPLFNTDLFLSKSNHSQSNQISYLNSGSDCLAAIITAALDILGFVPGVDCVIQISSYFAGQVSSWATAASDPGIFSAIQVYSSVIVAAFRIGKECIADIIPVVNMIAGAIVTALDIGRVAIDCDGVLDEHFQIFFPITPVGSYDPNLKIGSKGIGEEHYLSGEEPLRYMILFENLGTATAPAQEVLISDTLDIGKIDIKTFNLGPIFVGRDIQIFPPYGLSAFTTEVDLRPRMNLILRINATIDKATGILKWIFRSLDPKTGDLTNDPLVGFLPPNINPPEGEGSIVFTIMPNAGLQTGSPIQNHATIVFDTNEPIITAVWTNTIDNTPPSSQVSSLYWTEGSTELIVVWNGSDDASGISDYTIFVSENDSTFLPWLINKTSSLDTVKVNPDKKYAFYSIARDKTGNLERKPEEPDITTDSIGRGIETFELQQNYPNPFNTSTTIKYDLPVACEVKLVIYNIFGQRVLSLIQENQPAGLHLAQWGGKNDIGIRVASGIYLYRIQTKDFVKTRKMLLLR